MRLLELNRVGISNTKPESKQDYPDEVLESEWNPVLEEIRSLLSNIPEAPKQAPAVIDAAPPLKSRS